MPLEIERKFLVDSDAFRKNSSSLEIKQVYLSISEKIAVRVRIDGINASIAIKSKISNRVNKEYEYSIPIDEAQSLINLDDHLPVIRKTRYLVEFEGRTWEVDEFHDENDGLIVAEIELDTENDLIDLPPWIGAEVTDDYRYLNSNLSINPFCKW